MRGLYIIGEGPTEEQFVNEVLRKYFIVNEIYDVRCILMRTSPGQKGGAVSFDRFKHNVERLIKYEDDIVVTSLIDFFRLKSDFQKYQEAQIRHPNDKVQRVNLIEEAINEKINHPRFIPYIQLHEFEAYCLLLMKDLKSSLIFLITTEDFWPTLFKNMITLNY